MKKNKIVAVIPLLLLILFVAPQVSAMEVWVDMMGNVHMSESRVLGDSDEDKSSDDNDSEQESEDKDDDQDEDEDEVENDDDEDDDRSEVKTEVRTISPYQNKQFEFKQEDDGRYKIEIQDGKDKLKLRGTKKTASESVETDAVNLSLPLKASATKLKEQQLEMLKKRIEKQSEGQNLNEEDKAKLVKEKQEQLSKYYQKIAEERKQKQAEQIKLRSVEENGGGFELESNAAKAKLRGADFNYDQDTGLVSIVTPSGNTQTLTHLPDEAIAQMSASGFFIDSDQEVEIETTNDDSIQYKVATKKNKKLLGIFNRQVDAEVVMDDLTGEVSEVETTPTGFWSSLLNRFSY